MWRVSSSFLNAIITAPTFIAQATVTPPGGTAIPLQIESGTVAMDASNGTRRTVDIVVQGNSVVYGQIMVPGAILQVQAGVQYGSTQELVPVFYGEITSGVQDLGAGTIEVQGGDMTVRLARNQFITAFTPGTVTRVAALTQALRYSIPSATLVNTSSDTGLVAAGSTWTAQSSPMDVITSLTLDGGTELLQRPDGSWLLRNLPVLNSAPVWTLTRSLTTAKRQRPFDALYNTVVVTASAAGQTWPQQVAQITDTTNPLHPNYIGVSPYFLSSATITTAAEALAAARTMLALLTAKPMTLDLGLVTNPALEGGDVMTVIAPTIGAEAAQTFRHFVDSFSFDLTTGAMTLGTRQTLETD